MFGGTYFGEGYFAGEPATQQAQADNAPPAPVVPPVVPPPSNWAPSAFLTRLTADPVTIDALGVPLVARVQLAPSATPVPWMTRPRVTEPPSSVPVVPFIASLAPSRAIPVAPVIARSTADPVPDVPPAPLVARAVPAVFVPAPLVDRVTADPAPDETDPKGKRGLLVWNGKIAPGAERKITLALTDGARARLGDEGYDPVYGARPLKRVIQKELQDQLAQKLLSGEILDGAVVPVGVKDGALAVGAAGAVRRPSAAVH